MTFSFKNWEENRINPFLSGVLLKSASEFSLQVCDSANQREGPGGAFKSARLKPSSPPEQAIKYFKVIVSVFLYLFLFDTSLK